MNKQAMRLLEVGAIALFAILGVKAHEINDTGHLFLYILAATLVAVWIVIDTCND